MLTFLPVGAAMILSCFFFLPAVNGAVECTMTDPVAVDPNGEVMLQQLLNEEEGTVTMIMTYTGGKAWVGLGINDAGRAQMTPATVVIGWGSTDGSPTVPMTYDLTSKAADASGVVPTSFQTLLNNSIFEQTETTSTLTFTQFIDDFGTGNAISDDSQWIFAVGSSDNGFGFHPIVGGFQLALTSNCIDDDEVSEDGQQDAAPSGGGIVVDTIEHPERSLWMAHGILLGLAWGVCAPIAIGAAVLRGGFDRLGLPEGTWFKVHFFMNVLTVWMTIAGVIIAVVATNNKEDDTVHGAGTHHHKEDGTVHGAGTHHKVGFCVLVLAVLQAAGGKLRPGLTKAAAAASSISTSQHDKALATTAHSENKEHDDSKEDSDTNNNNKDDEGEELNKKSTVRVAWEWGHRIIGLVLLGLAWANCHTGIDWFIFNWQDDEGAESLTGVFWGVTAGISGLVILLSIGLRLIK
jgi:hypothetical protein